MRGILDLDDITIHSHTSKGILATIQNELLECIFSVYQEEVAKQVSEALFIAIQADERTDMS